MNNQLKEPDLSYAWKLPLLLLTVATMPALWIWQDKNISSDEFLIRFLIYSCTALGMSFTISTVSLCTDLRNQWRLGNKMIAESRAHIAQLKDTFVTQNIINQKLQDLAVTFDAVCEAHISLTREDSHDSSLESMEKEIATIKSKVAITKEAFWDAHKLAKELGFHVQGKYQQYLTPQAICEPPELAKSGEMDYGG